MKKSFIVRAGIISVAILTAVSFTGCSQVKDEATGETATVATAESGLSESIDFVSSLDAESITEDFVNENLDQLKVVSRNMNPILASKVITILNQDGGEKVAKDVKMFWVYAKHGNSALVQIPMPVFDGEASGVRYSNASIISTSQNIEFKAVCDSYGCVTDDVQTRVDNVTTEGTTKFVAEDGSVGYVEDTTDDGVTGTIFYQIPAVSNASLTFDGPCTVKIEYTISNSATDKEMNAVNSYFEHLGLPTE